ncbi:MAG: FAD/NAD(P)-binding protein [Alphaproteobacteria bacterium]|nr:FAD/NAD(P)-binding protein [Alphaproteobacteria bacterium]
MCDCKNVKAAEADPMRPRPFRVTEVVQNLSDTFTMVIKPVDGQPVQFLPGQSNMLYVFGVGEVPISISGNPADKSAIVHTTRSVGKVSAAIAALKVGDTVGVRGPFGTTWPVSMAEGKSLAIISGGVGLAPVRPTIYSAINDRSKFKKVTILYGARTPEDILFAAEIEKWRARGDMDVQVTVDKATGSWSGNVGLVTKLIDAADLDAANTVAFVCGPEIMMHFSAKSLVGRGVPLNQIYLSMERNMKCGVGLCGHCQWGTDFVCRDGPVFRYDQIVDALKIKEL